jgi:predicted regulator of Ras-like GTPase activity (Roadblock/LC7/MglB family)
MAMRGNLKDMVVADLIQHICQDRKTAKLNIQHAKDQAILYFKEGRIDHAVLGEYTGEEVIYRILNWAEGTFDLENGVEPPQVSITNTWEALLMEGARRLDENSHDLDPVQKELPTNKEVESMDIKLEDILKEMSTDVSGYIASTVVGMDGLSLASHARTKGLDVEVISAQATMLFKLVETSVTKLGAGSLEDNLTTLDNAYIMMHFLPGNKQFFLALAVDRKTGNLGNMRLISKMAAERISKAMPR